jgi:DNA repair exonuclease SbcCD ATPase subunit
MARPGVGADRITETITQLEAEGIEPTVTAVRERLGSGSFSTIGVVLSDWRQSQAKETRPAVPEPSDLVRGLFGQLWSEAWTSAMKTHEPERLAFARDRQQYERGKAEMLSEIERLEAQVESEKQTAAATIEELTAERARLSEELQGVRVAIATAEGALSEARKRADQEQERNRELSERVIAEAARAQALAARVAELEKSSPSA